MLLPREEDEFEDVVPPRLAGRFVEDEHEARRGPGRRRRGGILLEPAGERGSEPAVLARIDQKPRDPGGIAEVQRKKPDLSRPARGRVPDRAPVAVPPRVPQRRPAGQREDARRRLGDLGRQDQAARGPCVHLRGCRGC